MIMVLLMSIRNYLKKLGRRAAGTWGRVNHKRDMRAASKGVRKSQVDNDYLTMTLKEFHELEDALDRFELDDPEDYH